MLHLRLFTHLQVLAEGASLTPRLRPRAQRLLAYLLLQRAGALSRERMAFTLWPDQPEAEALGTLRRALSDLRTTLPPAGEWVLATRDELAWNTAAPYWLDLELYERWLGQGGLAAQHDAVALYSGDLLADWDDDWLLGERERLRQRQSAALRQLVAHHRGLADYEAALGFARQVVALEPLAEAGWREVMALRYAAGDRAAALAEYERLRAVLCSELDVAPMPETQALAAAEALVPTGVPTTGLPISYTLNYSHSLPLGQPVPPQTIKLMLTGRVELNGHEYYVPLLPCVTDFALVPALTLPQSATLQNLVPALGALTPAPCHDQVYYFEPEAPSLPLRLHLPLLRR